MYFKLTLTALGGGGGPQRPQTNFAALSAALLHDFFL